MGPKVILNAAGQPIVLNKREQLVADINQAKCNSLGFEIPVTTLTTIMKKITEQKFFQVAPAEYLPVRVGEGAWSSNLVTYRSFDLGDEFETGVINTGGNNGRLAMADAGIDSLSIKVINWAKSIGWTLPELELAAKSGSWDLITAKEKARKKNWDLGIQRIAFLGARGDTGNVMGLLNQVGVTISNFITAPISGLSVTALKTFCAGILEQYRSNCARTAWPTHFIVPESDYNGMASQASADFPVISVLKLLEDMFKVITQNQSFKILPLSYGDVAYNSIGKQCYVLLNYDEEAIRMDIPVDYTNTLANSIDNFSFQNVGYGQFTGVLAYRPAEILYFQY